mmetsp:Transcript_14170/g.16133  ORF Transcript_14170/g.16133 Transcript_14170/m.16133 type:complete len:434 (-) Transcript_14170:501-1802(-)
MMDKRESTSGATQFEVLQTSRSCILVDRYDKVKVHAIGYFEKNMQSFWKTKDVMKNEPLTFTVGTGKVIKGWDLGCIGMREGEVRRIFVPAKEGYGSKGYPPYNIMPNDNLVFEIECVQVLGKAKRLPSIDIKQSGTGEKKLLFMHGWPDDEGVWEHQISCFSKSYTCFSYTLPWFGKADDARRIAKLKGYDPSGYSFEELVDAIALAVSALLAPGEKIVVIGHDWGGYTAELLNHRHHQLVERLIVLDVSLKSMPAPSLLRTPFELIAVGLLYQWPMIIAYGVSQQAPGFAKWLATRQSSFVKRTMLRTCDPRYKHIAKAKSTSGTGEIGYVYWEFQKNSMKTALGYRDHQRWKQDCPTLFLYGNKKPFMFHAKDWAKRLNKVEFVESASIGLPCGHWLQIEQMEEVNEIISGYLSNPVEFTSRYKYVDSKI